MSRARALALSLLPLVGGILTLATPLIIYYTVVSSAYSAYREGVLSLSSVLVAKAAIATSCLPPTLATLVLGVWCLTIVIIDRESNPLLSTLIAIAVLLSLFQTCYYATVALSSSSLVYSVSLRVSKVVEMGIAHAYSYALKLCSDLAALSSSPSAVLGAALLGLGLLERRVRSLPRATLILTYLASAIYVARTALALLAPVTTPIGTTIGALVSMAIGVSALQVVRKGA